MLTGDFNFPNIDWETSTVLPTKGADQSASAKMLMEFMDNHLLSQVVRSPTRNHNILDLVLVNNDRIIQNVNSVPTCLSDHNLVSVDLTYNPTSPITHPLPDMEKHSFRSIDYHNCNYELVNEHLAAINWDELKELCDGDEDGSDFLNLFNLTVLQVLLINAPPKPQGKDITKNKFRHQRTILNRKKKKLTARLRALNQHDPSSPITVRAKAELAAIHIQIRDSINEQLEDQETKAVGTVKLNPRYFFSYAKRFAKCKDLIGPLRTASNQLTKDPKEMADLLQKQYMSVFSDPKSNLKKVPLQNEDPPEHGLENIDFTCDDIIEAIKEIDVNAASCPDDIPAKVLNKCAEQLAYPLSIIWTKSFDKSAIPSSLKIQFINPIFKKGDKTKAANYRPISLTSHVIKIFERIVRKRIIDYLESNNKITDSQHGFRSGRSCFTQLLDHVDNILKNLQENKEVDVIYLDYAKAFDKVDHEILLKKLSKMGIQGKLLNWIKDFLTNKRYQTVLVNGKRSFLAEVLSGVPQGSVLGPLLFLIYINDLVDAVKASKVSSFADDTKISRPIEYEEDVSHLQNDLNIIIAWSIENNMDLHEDKFEVLNYKIQSSKLLKELPFTSSLHSYQTSAGQFLLPSTNVKDLGVILTPDCQWTTQINTIAENAKRMASWVLGTFKNRSKTLMILLFKSMVRSRLEYCSALWNPHKIQDIQRLEAIQRSFTRRISGCDKMNYWERLEFLQLPSLQRRRERYMIINAWKILNGKIPNDIGMSFYKSERHGERARVPPTAKHCPVAVNTLYENSFSVKAAKLWNTLPKSVNSTKELSIFKAALGKFLERFPDKPPTPGYVAECHNSILDWKYQSGGLRDV